MSMTTEQTLICVGGKTKMQITALEAKIAALRLVDNVNQIEAHCVDLDAIIVELNSIVGDPFSLTF